MNAEIVKVKLDEAQWVVLGTLMAGILSPKEATDLARIVDECGGLQLFPDAWSNELWRRAKAAIDDRKPPGAYITIKQVDDVPMDILARLGDNTLPSQIIEDVYIPELVAGAHRRKLRAALVEALETGDMANAVSLLKQPTGKEKQLSKPQLSGLAIDEWETAFKNPGQLSGITTGLIDLDRLTWGWQPGQLIVIGARPSQGKTAMLLGFARASMEAEIPTLFVTLESSPKELTKRLVCQMALVNQMDLRGGLSDERSMAKVAKAFHQFQKHPIWIADLTGKSIAVIQSSVKRMVENYGIKIIFVDYLQKIKPDAKHEKRTYEVAQASEGLKVLAKELNVPVITAAQLNREPDKNKGRPPMLSDLADSGQIERDADLVGLIYRTVKEGGEVAYSLLVSKFRDGPTGAVNLAYHPEYARFDNFSRIEQDYGRRPHND